MLWRQGVQERVPKHGPPCLPPWIRERSGNGSVGRDVEKEADLLAGRAPPGDGQEREVLVRLGALWMMHRDRDLEVEHPARAPHRGDLEGLALVVVLPAPARTAVALGIVERELVP